MINRLYSLILILAFFIVSAQNSEECATENIMRTLYQSNPNIKLASDNFNKKLSEFTKSGKKLSSTTQVYEIPIVVHIISDGSPLGSNNNKSDQQIIDWINYTNDVLSATAPGMLPEINGGAVIPVKLVFAKIDPNCNITNGINRVDMSDNSQYVNYGANSNYGYNGVPEDVILEKAKWDPTKYYNIYVVNQLSAGTVVANGYAYYPSGYSRYDHSFMRASVSAVGYQTMPHEFGHALGLMHTHEGSSGSSCPENTDCTLDGDMVCDTEPSISLYDSSVFTGYCLSGNINECTGNVYNGVEKNVMSYTSCFRDRFTIGQRDRAMFQMLEYRQSLLNSPVTNTSIINNNKTVVSACIPASTSGTVPQNNNIGISYVNFGNIDNYSDALTYKNMQYYLDYTKNYCHGSTNTVIPIGQPTLLTIKTGFQPTNHNVRVYIDYNNNGIFEVDTETVLTRNNVSGGAASIATSITPPSNAVTNIPLRMRVIGDISSVIISPCYLPKNGQIEDYSVTISPNMSTTETSVDQKISIAKADSGNIIINSEKSKIFSIKIHDASGRQLYLIDNINKNEFLVQKSFQKGFILYITIKLNNNDEISRKVKL